jgi:hypothetical protein
MISEREEEMLKRHIQEAEARAAMGGHVLAAWRKVPFTGLFVQQTYCTLCGEQVQAGHTTLYVSFGRYCSGAGTSDLPDNPNR